MIKAVLFDFWDTIARKKLLGGVEPIPGSLDLLTGLSSYTIALISNTSTNSPKIILQELGVHPHINHYFLSSDTGYYKPDYEAFKHALEVMCLDPDECIFIDDSETNVAAARDCGLHGIVFQNAEQTRDELEKLGVMFKGV